jgi:hypothetical protein
MLLLAALAATLHGETDARYNKAAVEPVKTSIYIGYVKLTAPLFTRTRTGYVSSYKASVFPFFFLSEHGQLTIAVSDDDLQRLAHGGTVLFNGQAQNSDGETRVIVGRAVPQDATQGKLTVRLFISKQTQLIFNTTYRFVGGP